MNEYKLDKMITLQEQTLKEIKGLELQVQNIEKRLKENEKEANNIKIECAKNSKSITYQWAFIVFICFLILLLFSNV